MSTTPSHPRARVVVCDDEPAVGHALVLGLSKAGHDVVAFEDGRQALAHLAAAGGADLVITDMRMPAMGGIDLLKEVKARWPATPVVVITAFASIPTSFEAGQAGADRYMEKPLDIHEVRRLVSELLEHRAAPEAGGELLPGFLGTSPAIREVAEKVRQVAPTHATVLLLGESGTGKDLVANAIHQLSRAAGRIFLPLNCAAIPGHLLESELFGHERGSFTGAVARQAGKFELADSGTLFLDEIGELAADLQAKLLRVLEDRKFMRVGGSAPIPFDARLVAASNRDLEKAVADGRFREDLYYRLKVVSIDIPPLRERPEDVPILAEHFLRHFVTFYAKGHMSFSREALAALEAHRWEGNVRELRNMVESLVVLARSGTIDLAHLPQTLRRPPAERVAAPVGEAAADVGLDGPRTMRDIERDAILQALKEHGGNRDRAARHLGIGLRTLQRKIKEYRDQGLDV